MTMTNDDMRSDNLRTEAEREFQSAVEEIESRESRSDIELDDDELADEEDDRQNSGVGGGYGNGYREDEEGDEDYPVTPVAATPSAVPEPVAMVAKKPSIGKRKKTTKKVAKKGKKSGSKIASKTPKSNRK